VVMIMSNSGRRVKEDKESSIKEKSNQCSVVFTMKKKIKVLTLREEVVEVFLSGLEMLLFTRKKPMEVENQWTKNQRNQL